MWGLRRQDRSRAPAAPARFCCPQLPISQGQGRVGPRERAGREAREGRRPRPPPPTPHVPRGPEAAVGDAPAVDPRTVFTCGRRRRGLSAGSRRLPKTKARGSPGACAANPSREVTGARKPQELSRKLRKQDPGSPLNSEKPYADWGGGGSCGKVDWTKSLHLFIPMSSLPPIPPQARSDPLIPGTGSCSL